MIRIAAGLSLALLVASHAGAVTVEAGSVVPVHRSEGAVVLRPEQPEANLRVRDAREAVTAGVHEEALPTPPLALVLATAALGGILMLGRRDRRPPFS